MNKIVAEVIDITNESNLYFLKLKYGRIVLSFITLNLESKIKLGSKVILQIKPLDIGISKNFVGSISYSNKLDTTIRSIENGRFFSSIEVSFIDSIFEVMVELKSAKDMNLKVDDKVTILIDSTSFYLSEILDD